MSSATRRCSRPRSSTSFSDGCSASSCSIRAISTRSSTSPITAIRRTGRSDGELARERYTLTSYLLWVLGPTYWYTRVRRIIRFSFGVVTEPYIPEDRKADVIREARWHLAGYAADRRVLSIADGKLGRPVQLWLLPMLAMKPVHQLQNTIEHLGLPHVDAITENTRTTRTNAVMRWMCWNMQYHTAHHAFPGVPCYALPQTARRDFRREGPQATDDVLSRLSMGGDCAPSGTGGRRPTIPTTRSGSATTRISQPVAPRARPAKQA